MNEFARINAMLVDVGQRNGIQGLYLSHEGICSLRLRDGSHLCFELVARTGKLFIYTPLLDLPNEQSVRLAVFERIAGLNCMSPYKGTLAAHLPTSSVLYQIGLDTKKITAEQIDETLETLLNERPSVLEQLKKNLPTVAHEDTSVPVGASVKKTTMASPWLDELRALQKKDVRFRYQSCSETEIALLEAELNDRLPAQYRRFLAHTGRGSDLLFIGEDIFFPNLLSFGERAKEMLKADGARFTLPKDAFVFCIHQDVQFLFFNLGAGDDPPVYSYSYEEGAKGFTKTYQSFSEFMHVYIAMHSKSSQTLSRLNIQQ